MNRMDCVRNEVIRNRLQWESVVSQVMRKRERWKDKVMGNHGTLTKKVVRGQERDPGWMESNPEGDRRKDGVMISDGCRIVPLYLTMIH